MKKQFFFIVVFILSISLTSCDEYETCPSCNGRGTYSYKETCTTCKGKGERRCNYSTTQSYNWFGGGGKDIIKCRNGKLEGYRSQYNYHNGETCPSCNGSAFVECYTCDGFGYKSKSKNCNTCNGSGQILTKYGEFVN